MVSNENPKRNGENGDLRDKNGRFVEGHPPHPKAGRPKNSLSITDEIRRKLLEIPKITDSDGNPVRKTYLELLVTQIIKQAILEGNDKMIKEIWNYVDGMPKQRIDIAEIEKNLKEISDGLQETYDNQDKAEDNQVS